MTLKGVMAFTSRYFNEFAKPASQLIIGSSSIELIDQKSDSLTHRAVKLACVTKFTHSHIQLVIYRLSFDLPFCWFLVASGLS